MAPPYWCSQFLDAVRLYAGNWLARSPRSESAARGSARLSVAFYVPTPNENVARLTGGVTGKRVAARQRLAEDFWFGSVSVRFFQCRRIQVRRGRRQQFSRLLDA